MSSVIFVDVDDTLIRTFGTKQIPITGAIEYVRVMHRLGHTLYCWSRGGAKYAEAVASSLGIGDCFAGFLPKPDVLLDDRLRACLDHCEFVHPNNASHRANEAAESACQASDESTGDRG